jgi:predicted XRE-type DNA-binding protein
LVYSSYHNGLCTQKELADYFGVNQCHISNIVRKKKWKHLWSEAT